MVKSARPRSLNRELLWIQISLLLTMAAAVILCGFLIGPPLIGFLGEQIGLLNAFWVVAVLAVLAGLCARAAREPS